MNPQDKQVERTQHTSGPWHLSKTSNGWCIASKGTGVALTIAPDDDISHANARLIAAAPETVAERDRLLAALKSAHGILARISSPDSRWENISMQNIRAAIAKAEGRAQ